MLIDIIPKNVQWIILKSDFYFHGALIRVIGIFLENNRHNRMRVRR